MMIVVLKEVEIEYIKVLSLWGTEQEVSQCDSYDMTLQPRHRYVAEIYCNGTYMEMIQLGFII